MGGVPVGPSERRRLLLRNIGRLFTSGDRGVLTDAAVLIDEGGEIVWVGSEGDDRPPMTPDQDVDVGGALVSAGLIDAHTHPVYAGDRLAEITLRSAGASYQEIAAAGGGISGTVMATRAVGYDDLTELVRGRLGPWLAGGTTTVEAKTGYHLARDGELAAVGLLGRLDGEPRLPRIEVTFLGAHDLPPDTSRESPDAWAGYAEAVASWCPAAAEAGARFVDVFCDAGYFGPEPSRQVLAAGRRAGLCPRVHADELARSGGSFLAAELDAVSADHLLCISDDEAVALADAGVVAVLCPVTALALGRTPPARLLLERGVTVALGSDHNPGQSGTTSMSLVVGLAVHTLGLSVDEALRAATRGGAAAVATPHRGSVEVGQRADLVAWDAEHEGAFAWELGLKPRQVWLNGQAVDQADAGEPRTGGARHP